MSKGCLPRCEKACRCVLQNARDLRDTLSLLPPVVDKKISLWPVEGVEKLFPYRMPKMCAGESAE
jgi:hypothetical protein